MAEPAQKNTALRWLLGILRYGLCAVAILFLYYNVTWYDSVTLAADGATRVRLIEIRGSELVIEKGGEEVTIPHTDVQRLPDGEVKVLYGIHGVATRMKVNLALWALLLFGPVPFCAALRLVWMLRIQDVRLRLWDAVKLTFAGNFFNFALPGSTGGDLYKAYYITHYTHHKTEAVTTVFLDRVVGLLGLMILASLMFALAWTQIEWDPAYRVTVATVLAAVWGGLAVLSLLVFSRRLRHGIGLPALAARLPASEQLLRIGRATVAMRSHKALLGGSLLVTMFLQMLVVLSAFLMARAIRLEGIPQLYFIGVPIGFLIQAVPITPPQAFGVLEYAYIQFFARGALLGTNPDSAAVAFALAVRVIQLAWAIPGVLVPLLGAHMPRKEELQKLDIDDEGATAPRDAQQPRPAGSP